LPLEQEIIIFEGKAPMKEEPNTALLTQVVAQPTANESCAWFLFIECRHLLREPDSGGIHRELPDSAQLKKQGRCSKGEA
jgi:hypothetical protein